VKQTHRVDLLLDLLERLQLEFVYDSQGRRVKKTVSTQPDSLMLEYQGFGLYANHLNPILGGGSNFGVPLLNNGAELVDRRNLSLLNERIREQKRISAVAVSNAERMLKYMREQGINSVRAIEQHQEEIQRNTEGDYNVFELYNKIFEKIRSSE